VRSSASPSRGVAIANVLVMIIASLVLLPGGGDETRTEATGRGRARPADVRGGAGEPGAEATGPADAPPRKRFTATVESARKAKANELGLVPVLMYHRIVKKRTSSLDRTPKQLRKELERLARAGYVPVTAAEYASGRIDIPAGAHPVVLTFDDGTPGHFALDASGRPHPDTAVGVLLDVARRHPGFRPVATFWVNRDPFGLKDPEAQAKAVGWLVRNGFGVANHTYGHADLRRLSRRKIAKEIVRQERLLRRLGAPPSATFALPYGNLPGRKNRRAAHRGSWDGTRYDFSGVFLAGAEPAPSPHSKDFRPQQIPRIQANGKGGECRRWCSAYWLEWLDRHPSKRYTSDGDPDHVSIPKRLQGNIAQKRTKRILAY
jgi:peptidoglycan/xylan/chitin deacetylase (PgdA/CDA1 family)